MYNMELSLSLGSMFWYIYIYIKFKLIKKKKEWITSLNQQWKIWALAIYAFGVRLSQLEGDPLTNASKYRQLVGAYNIVHWFEYLICNESTLPINA
jgi:hypothetical protein